MIKTEGAVVQEYLDYSVEQTLFTYSEEEKEENRLNKMNAELVLNPKFIPVNPRMLQEGFSLVEATLFGFIDFFLSNNDKFYCTNEQIAKMLNTSVKTISLAFTTLKSKGLIDTTYKMRGGGGKIRFIHLVKKPIVNYDMIKSKMDDITKSKVATLPKHTNIENKYIENNIIKNNNIGDEKKLSWVYELVQWNDFVAMRKQIKKPMTPRAEQMLVHRLEELADGKKEQAELILEQSIISNWTNVYPLSGDYKKKYDENKEPQTMLEKVVLYNKLYNEYKEKELEKKYGEARYKEVKRNWALRCANDMKPLSKWNGE